MSDFNTEHNKVVWLDIPVVDLDRAVAFYRAVLDCDVAIETFGEMRFAIIAHDQGNGGCLITNPDEVAADRGMLVYFNVDGRLQEAVGKVTELGGEITQPVHSLGPHGFRAVVRDSEGNRLAIHAHTET